jgi:hypothetical protein
MKVLIGAPRTGSSYVYEHIAIENLRDPTVKKPHQKAEFLNPAIMPETSIAGKVEFLIKEKEKGIHYTFKHHINYLMTPDYDYYNNWFKDFYKEDTVLVLKRRDIWQWALSFMWQELVDWQTAGIIDVSTARTINININTTVDLKKSLDQFFNIKDQLDTVDGNVIYYEDLKFPFSKFHKLSDIINYEDTMSATGVNLKEIGEYYEKKKASTTVYT